MKLSSTPRALSAVAVLAVAGLSGCGTATVPSTHAPAGITSAAHTRSPRDLSNGLIHAAAVSDSIACAYDGNGQMIKQPTQVSHGFYGPYTMSTLPANWATFFANYNPWANYPTLPAYPMIYALQSDVDAFSATDAPFTIDYQSVAQTGSCPPISGLRPLAGTGKAGKIPIPTWYDPLTMPDPSQ